MAYKSVKAFYGDQLNKNEFHEKGGRTDHATFQRLFKRVRVNMPSILDLGCGDGALPEALARSSVCWRRYVGIDVFGRLLQLFKKRGLPNVTLRETDATAPAYRAKSFDIVISSFLLEHFSELDGTRHLEFCAATAREAVLLSAPLVLSSDFVVDLGLKGPVGKETRKWNWGEIAVRRRLHRAGMHKIDFEAYWNPNGTIHEYYLLARRAA